MNPPDTASLAATVAAHIERAERPLPLSSLGTALRKAGLKVRNSQLPALLARLASEGRAFDHPIARQGRNASPCYWHQPADQYVEATLRTAISGGGEWTETQLRRALPKAYHDLVDEVIGRLLSTGELFEGPPKGKSRRFRTIPARPTEALGTIQVKSLRTVLQRVNALRRPALRLEDLIEFLDGAVAGRTGAPPAAVAPTEELLLRFYREDLPRREGLRSMPIAWTWRRFEAHCREHGGLPDAERFHALLRELATSGQVALTAHDSPSRLPPEELALLGREPNGRILYYWTPLR